MPTFQLKRVFPAKHNEPPYDVVKHLSRQKIVTKNNASILTYTAPDYPMGPMFLIMNERCSSSIHQN